MTLPDGRAGRALTAAFSAFYDVEVEDQAPGAADRQTSHLPAPAPTPIVYVTVARETREMDASLARITTYLAFTCVVLIAGVALLVPAVVRRGLRPLNAIAEHASRLQADSLLTPFPSQNLPRELMPITSRLNTLLERLSAAFERESRFTRSAAHELRTPIAEIRAAAEVALRWPEPEQSQRALADVVSVSVRVEALVESLLKMARHARGRSASDRRPSQLPPLSSRLFTRSPA